MAMMRRELGAVPIGARLALPVYNDRGAVWLKSGTELTERYIELLRSRGVAVVHVDHDGTEGIAARELLTDETRGSALAAVAYALDECEQAADRMRSQSVDDLEDWSRTRDGFAALRAMRFPERLREIAPRIVAEVVGSTGPLAIATPKGRDGYLLSHAVDVAATAVMIGRALGLARESLVTLAQGCLSMDIGLSLIDRSILDKPGPLTGIERLAVQDHPRLGYAILRTLRPADILANNIALQHHERQDGRGYPRGLTGVNRVHLDPFDPRRGKIILLAEIAAVADVYDALCSNRPQRAALTPEGVVATMRRLSGTHLNDVIVDEFLRIAPVYAVGQVVYVEGSSIGRVRGVVARPNRHAPDRPIVRVIQDADGTPVTPFEIDLAAAPRLAIRGAPLSEAA